MGTVPMVFDDGSSAHVPQEKVQAALRDGGQVVQSMRFDDGSSAYVPLHKVRDALADGGTVIGAPPRAPAAPVELTRPVSMSEPLGMYGGPSGEVRANPTFAQTAGDVAVAAGTAASIPLAGAATNAAQFGAGYGYEAVKAMAAAHPVAAAIMKKALLAAGGATAYKHSKWLLDVLP